GSALALAADLPWGFFDLLGASPSGRMEARDAFSDRRGRRLGPGNLVPPARLVLLPHRHGDLAELLGQPRLVLEQLQDAVGAGESSRAAADDDDAGLEPLLRRIGWRTNVVPRIERRRKLSRLDWHYEPFLALIASVTLGTILWRSPTTPRSENSKIGAFWSLLIARMFSEFCIPTLCWIAPEMPSAR